MHGWGDAIDAAPVLQVKLSGRAQTALHDYAFAAGGILAAGGIAVLSAAPLVGAVAAALVSTILHAAWPSAKARADRQAMEELQRQAAELRQQVAAFDSPRRMIEDAKTLEQLRRYGPLFPGDR